MGRGARRRRGRQVLALRAEVARDLKPVYTAVSETAALDAFAEFSAKWEKRYPAIIRLWENAWPEFVPFLAFDNEIRT